MLRCYDEKILIECFNYNWLGEEYILRYMF